MSRIIKQSSNDNSTLDPALIESVESNIAQLDARSIITLQTTSSFRQIAKPTLFTASLEKTRTCYRPPHN